MGGGDSSLTIGQTVVTWARGKLDQEVGPERQCYDLADLALGEANAKSARDYGKITKTANYVWGKAVALKDAQPGDILQFKSYKTVVSTRIVTIKKRPEGTETTTETKTQEITRPHHTAIVESNNGKGQFTVLEQNAPEAGKQDPVEYVIRNVLMWKSYAPPPEKKLTQGYGGASSEVTTTVSYKVTGSIIAYRPQPKSKSK